MRYKIIRNNYLNIDDQVNKHLSEGWALHGYPFAMGGIIMQAMVLHNASDEIKPDAEEAEAEMPEGSKRTYNKKQK